MTDSDLAVHYQELLIESKLSPEVRKKSATVRQKDGDKTRYRFPMPDKEHARKALQMLPRAKGLSKEEKEKIRRRANKILYGNPEGKKD